MNTHISKLSARKQKSSMEIEKPRIATPVRWEVVRLRMDGRTYREIEEETKISKSQACALVHKFEVHGHLHDLPGAGRPPALNSREERSLVRSALKSPGRSIRDLAKTALPYKPISVGLTHRILTENDIHSYRLVAKTELTQEAKRKRLEWCLEHREWTLENWSRVIFTDETKFTNEMPRIHYRRRSSDPPLLIETKKNGCQPLKVLLWGSISYLRVGRLVRIHGILNGEEYKKVLEEHLYPEFEGLGQGELMLQHDNAPVHRAAVVKEFLDKNYYSVIEWPPYSPDLNPIENLWAILKKKCKFTAKTEQELMLEAQNAWNSINTETLHNLFSSMPARIEAVIRAKGGHTKY